MKIKQLLTNIIWYGVIPKITAILSLLLLPLITPFLTLEDYGIMGLINSYKGIALGVATFGLHMHLTNSYFELGKNFILLWRRLFFYMIVSSLLTAIALTFIYSFSLSIAPESKKILIISLSIIPILFFPVNTIIEHYFPLVYKPRTQVLRNLIASVVSIGFSFVMIRYYNLGYVGWVVSATILTLLTFILFFKPLYIDLKIYPQVDFNFSRIKKLLKISLPIIPHNLSHMLLSSSDRIIMDILGVSVVSIGLYSNGYSIGENSNVVITGISIALSPVLQRIFREKNIVKMKYYYRLSNLIISVFILLVIFWMKEFYMIFVKNESLQPAYIVAILTSVSYLVNATAYMYLSTSIFINKTTNKILYLVFLPAIVNILLNFIFIPIYGFMAALYTTIFTYWLVFALPFLFTYFRDIIRNMIGSRKIMLEGLLINILVLGIAFFCYDINYIWKIIIIITIFALFYSYYRRISYINTQKN